MKIEVKTSAGDVHVYGDVASAVFDAKRKRELKEPCRIFIDGEEISYDRLLFIHKNQASRKSTQTEE